MTFDEIVQTVLDDLNLTSTDARARVERRVNQKYRELVAMPWMRISTRGTSQQTTAVGVPYVTFPVTKLFNLFDPINRPNDALIQVTPEEMQNITPIGDPCDTYCIWTVAARSVTLKINSIPGSVYPLQADGELASVTLSGAMEPRFSEKFHDILVAGAKWFEYDKLQMKVEADTQEGIWAARISDLKFNNAATSYIDYLQDKDRQNTFPGAINNIVK